MSDAEEPQANPLPAVAANITLEEVCAYIVQNASDIFVRVQEDGKWQNRSLAELPGALALRYGFDFIIRGVVPVVFTRDQEPTNERQ